MRRPHRTVLALAVVALLASAAPVAPQTVQYAYDAAGRLSVVADARGDLAVYDYDAVGNLLSIRRIAVAGASDPVVVALVTPGAARHGAMVSVFGKGFANAPATNTVQFNGAGAEVVAASPTRLTVTVPSGAVSGPITVSTPSGVGSSPESFRVLGTLGISPASAVVAPGASVAFSASGDGIGPVRWSVDGLVGGDAARGTITSDGLYVAPQSLPPDGVRITATSVEDAALHASARVTMIPPRPVFLTTRADVSVAVARPITTFAAATPLTVAVAPVVLDVAPSEGVRGETVRITVRGVGVAGATGLQFFAGPSADTALAVADFSVDAESDTATADIAIAADAVPGPRLVRLVTPSGASAAAGFGDSLFTVR